MPLVSLPLNKAGVGSAVNDTVFAAGTPCDPFEDFETPRIFAPGICDNAAGLSALLAIAGSVLGSLLSYLTRFVIHDLVPGTLIQAIVPGWWPIAAAIALAGAILGAIYPGIKAARQDAIEALAYE